MRTPQISIITHKYEYFVKSQIFYLHFPYDKVDFLKWNSTRNVPYTHRKMIPKNFVNPINTGVITGKSKIRLYVFWTYYNILYNINQNHQEFHFPKICHNICVPTFLLIKSITSIRSMKFGYTWDGLSDYQENTLVSDQ